MELVLSGYSMINLLGRSKVVESANRVTRDEAWPDLGSHVRTRSHGIPTSGFRRLGNK